MTKRTLITGATGFVGRQVLHALTSANADVVAVVRTGSNSQSESFRGVDTITTPDLFGESDDWWASACTGIDTVIHIAWYVEPGKYLQSPKNLDCLSGTLNLAKGAARAGIRRFVGIGTCFEYDLSAGIVSADTPLKPLSPYAGAKAAAYMALSNWLPSQSVEFAWCRLFYLYGAGEDERRLAPYLRSRLIAGDDAELTSGQQIRDFLDVAAAGQSISETASSNQNGAVNICSGVPTTVREFSERIADEYGRRDLLKFGSRPDDPTDPPCVVGIPGPDRHQKA